MSEVSLHYRGVCTCWSRDKNETQVTIGDAAATDVELRQHMSDSQGLIPA